MLIYYDPNCPFCRELSRSMSLGSSPTFDFALSGLEVRLRSHPSYVEDAQRHNYKKVPMIVTKGDNLLGGYDANNPIIRRLGVAKYIETYDI